MFLSLLTIKLLNYCYITGKAYYICENIIDTFSDVKL